MRFGRVTGNSASRRRQIYKEQWHLRDHLNTSLPLENDDYSKLPGDPQWNDDDLLDEEDGRDKPLKAGIGPFPA